MSSRPRDRAALLEILLDLGRDHQLLLRESAETEGLAPGHFEALRHLSIHGDIPLQELALALRITRSTVSRLATQLEKKGLAARRRDASDARIWRLFATEAGQEAAAAVEGELLRRLALIRIGATAQMPVEALGEALAQLNRRLVPPGGDRP